MEGNIFEYGIIVGRFQHIHKGHEKLINIGLGLCNTLLLYVTYSQVESSYENPYTIDYVIDLISKIYEKEIKEKTLIVKPLKCINDTSEVSVDFGDYVLNSAKNDLGKLPSLIIYGKDKNIFKCFSKEAVNDISEVLVDRKQMNISATQIRDMLVNDEIEKWKKYVNPKLHSEYTKLREILLKFKKSD